MTDQPATNADHTHDPDLAVTAAVEASRLLREQIGRVIVGQDEVIEQMLLAIFCRGHALVVGVPGLAKTLLISTIARTLNLQFSRIQFTPDLMPSDITGTEVIQEDKTTGRRQLSFVPGPVFANVILADEINRTPPKTQAALLEAMQERHVTVGGQRHDLPSPFFVLATQNPIEQEGTYPLPEAQLDRFMFQILIGYPSADEELEIVKRSVQREAVELDAVLDGEKIAQVQRLVRQTPVPDHVMKYALRLVRATRVDQPMDGGIERPEMVSDYVGVGAGPRASEYMVLAAKAKALIEGSMHTTPEHVKAVARPVLRHRIMLNYNAEADRVNADAVVDAMLNAIPVDGAGAEDQKRMAAVIKP